MSKVTARAEARRKAILSRGSDRLSKLTSSARGGEDSSYLNNQEPVSNKPSVSGFIGDDPPELPLPKHPSSSQQRFGAFDAFDGQPASLPQADPSVWSHDQQAEFMRALGMASAGGNPLGAPPPSLAAGSHPPTNSDPNMDFLNALMTSPQIRSPSPGSSSVFSSTSTAPFPIVPTPKTLLQKLLPLVHILSVWCLFGFFVLWREPVAYNVIFPWRSDSEGDVWRRWAELASIGRVKEQSTWSVQPLPFMWAFTTLELALFSFRIMSGFDPITPPTILTFVLPMLPPQLSSMILNGLRYLQMFGILLDDIAAVLVAVGFVIFICGWIAN